MPLSSDLSSSFGSFAVDGSGRSTPPFPIQRQLCTNWCWAVCTMGICRFYGRPPVSNDQKQFVATAFNNPVCTIQPNSCNDTADLSTMLGRANHLGAPVLPALSADDAERALNGGRTPFCCQMFIPNASGINTGHVVTVYHSFRDASQILWLWVADPIDGSLRAIPYTIFRSNFYNRGGFWNRTYITRP